MMGVLAWPSSHAHYAQAFASANKEDVARGVLAVEDSANGHKA